MIHFSLRQLEYFTAAARHGGAARAAEAMNVSQPSISKAIAELESLWGERLFVRLHARGLELTAAGQARLRQARTLLQQADSLAAPRTVALQGRLRIGCLSTLGPRYLPEVLARLQSEHPGIEVQLEEGDTETLTRQLERGALDVALLYDLGLARGVRLEPVTDLRPYALLPWGHTLAARSSLRLADLAREPLILINLPHSRTYFLSLFRAAGVTPHIAHESPSVEMVRAMVANGLGVSILTTRPARDISVDGKRIACRALQGALLTQSVVLAYPAEADQQPALTEVFARTVRVSLEATATARSAARKTGPKLA
ncbi:LysR substrate-binding domain-containing protein [Polaromonas jejuensis]|uniref:LysR substrate-binding domain-containing protein n=1 Tax=Polaromonas jejuensis TaxID=457502 RepID=A0ABW0Q8C7_9BURK|nr:LysR substrate-binding domain-containing protein [Polaromonas jejuensis]